LCLKGQEKKKKKRNDQNGFFFFFFFWPPSKNHLDSAQVHANNAKCNALKSQEKQKHLATDPPSPTLLLPLPVPMQLPLPSGPLPLSRNPTTPDNGSTPISEHVARYVRRKSSMNTRLTANGEKNIEKKRGGSGFDWRLFVFRAIFFFFFFFSREKTVFFFFFPSSFIFFFSRLLLLAANGQLQRDRSRAFVA
jgi:hypothetical protein